MRPVEAARALDTAHERLARDGTLEVELESLDQLCDAGEAAHLAGVVGSARHLPESVLVRVVLPAGPRDGDRAEVSFRAHCRAQAEDAWVQATTVRRAGLRQLAPSLAAAFVALVIAVGAGTLAENVGSALLAALLYAVAGIGAISAWVITWMPIEEILFDWRPPARVATTYDLLAHARIETLQRKPGRIHAA